MKLSCYALSEHPPPLRAARSQRDWMDQFPDRHPYRCLPLSIAAAFGWEVICPVAIEIEWNGGPKSSDIEIRARKPLPGGRPTDYFCRSHFTRGIVTFHLDYLFRTEPGWQLLATGPFNLAKDNASPLTGLVETDWLPYPFTMNWQILRPGRVVFEEGEPFCFIFPVNTRAVVDCEPDIRRLADDHELARQHDAFRSSRDAFLERHAAGDETTVKQAWQKHYFVGRHPDGTTVDEHIGKLRLKEPRDLRAPLATGPVTDGEGEPGAAGLPESNWQQDSPLNEFDDAQAAENEIGRRRIDGDGHLIDWTYTYVVRSQADAEGCDFVVVDDLLTTSECELLANAFAELADRTEKGEAVEPYWRSRFIRFDDVAAARPDAGTVMAEAQKRAVASVADFFRLKAPIYADSMQIVRWDAGMFMQPHADNAHPDNSEHRTAHRDLSGVIYLNDDYAGGELYFTALDIAIKPKRGMFVAFAAGFHHEHAVLRVKDGTRLTISSFFTFKSEKADPRLLVNLSQSG
jgi:predicted 2-oxoglutarate/Fe(II)-dependent dioxygenase YbiX